VNATHWLAGANWPDVMEQPAPKLAFKAGDPAGGAGQEFLGGALMVAPCPEVSGGHVPLLIGTLQYRSVEKFAYKHVPPLDWQSASERQGEQKLPSPTHVEALGMHAEIEPHCWPDPQSAALPHSGVHAPLRQCWNVPLTGGHSPSFVQAAPCAGAHTG
jgi:hypothetical protein